MKKTSFKLLITMLLSVVGTEAWADGSCGSGVTWTLSGETLTISKTGSGTGDMFDFYYSYYKEYNVFTNQPWHDYQKTIRTIIVKEGVTSIGDYAFYGCSNLTSVTISNSVTSIGEWAFYNCSDLTSITIPNSVTSIGNYAFQRCSGLASITFPNGIFYVEHTAFDKTAWYNNQPDGVVYAGLNVYNYKGTMPANASIAIKKGTLSIGGGAFSCCSKLTSVTIPNSVKNIGDYAFQYCSGLTSIDIPNSVTSIGDGAFSGCTGLTSITIPNSVTSIGNYAFYGCKSLISVTALNPTPVAITEDVFEYRSNATLYVLKGSKGAYQAANYWNGFKKIIEIETSGIEQIMSSENGKAMIFTIDGKRVDNLKKGMNVIRMKDGTIRKVVVK